MKVKYYNIFLRFIFIFFVSSGLKSFSQILVKPTFAFAGMCASPSYNTFDVNFNIISPNLFAANNVFYLEISDATGNFATPKIMAQSAPGAISTSPGLLNVVLPTNFVGGEGFKFRVRSSNPAQTSPVSVAIYAYYKPFTTSYTIYNNQSTATICDNNSLVLTVDKPELANLSFKWFKDNDEIIGQTTSSLTVTSAGMYDSQINYGSCTTGGTIAESQPVSVNVSTFGSSIVIASSLGNIVTPGNPTTLGANPVLGLTYQWHKNNVPIAGATNNEYITNQAGSYYMVVDNGICNIKTNIIQLTLFVPPIPTPGAASVIPNIVSPNNDGENDLWTIPNEYLAGNKTKITILDSRGNISLETDNYTNNWPQNSFDIDGVNPIYYYIITSEKETKKGSITIIK